ncbi:MAG: hypothetical protein ABGY11_13380, partial [Candidatus Thioglobus sp.]
MNTRKTEKVVNNHLLNKNILATAVATVMFGSSAAFATIVDVTGHDIVTTDSTTSYNIGDTGTLTINGGVSIGAIGSSFNGTIDGNGTAVSGGEGNIIIAGNLTMGGNVGSTNSTGNFTVNAGNTLVLENTVSGLTSENLTIGSGATLNFGNSTSGYSRSTALQVNANITLNSASVLNIGNGTSIIGDITGFANGQGTLNVLGNFTTSGSIGYNEGQDTTSKLEQINISAGNTFTINSSDNATATRMNINGTVTAYGSANITSSVTMGDGTLNLTNNGDSTATAAQVVGTIDGFAGSTGTLNVNGTWSTEGVIGGTRAIATINLDSDTTGTGHTYTFAHNVNATTINLGTSTSSNNATLLISEGITVTGAIVSSGNASAAGILDINNNSIFTGTIGASGAALETITIAADKEAT